MPPLPTIAIHTPLPHGSPAEIARAYHERTKHRLGGFAQGPETLDWEAQPSPYRRFAGAKTLPLPLLHELPPEHPCALALARPFRWPVPAPEASVGASRAALGVLLQASLGITAHKTLGPDRWAVRANPSSGNLHPVEAYVVARGIAFLPDGVHHYAPDAHLLEKLAQFTPTAQGPAVLAIALTSIQWRETWKYGERAFRYCQLDTGHAVAALGVAAAALGGCVRELSAFDMTRLAALLGLARFAQLPVSEREEPELLLRIELPGLREKSDADVAAHLQPSELQHADVTPSVVDPRPLYAWPMIERVAEATRSRAQSVREVPKSRHPAPLATAPPRATGAPSLAHVVFGRRSAQRFDIRFELPAPGFARILAALQNAQRGAHDVRRAPGRLDVVLMVHRVAGLVPGLYLLPCAERDTKPLRDALEARFAPTSVREPGELASLGLRRLCTLPPRELMRRARLLHCQQDIVSSSAFALGMLAPLDSALAQGAEHYRTLHREAGMLGHALYLAAEAEGLRGTGIGCFLDDEVHALLGLSDDRFQTLYHFTVGRPLVDARIESGPAYPERAPNHPPPDEAPR